MTGARRGTNIIGMQSDFERKVERRIRVWILEQEHERQRELQRRMAEQAAAHANGK